MEMRAEQIGCQSRGTAQGGHRVMQASRAQAGQAEVVMHARDCRIEFRRAGQPIDGLDVAGVAGEARSKLRLFPCGADTGWRQLRARWCGGWCGRVSQPSGRILLRDSAGRGQRFWQGGFARGAEGYVFGPGSGHCSGTLSAWLWARDRTIRFGGSDATRDDTRGGAAWPRDEPASGAKKPMIRNAEPGVVRILYMPLC